MDFVHDAYLPGETIAAIATPPGEGGVAIIRISGNTALSIATKIFTGPVAKYKSHTAHYGHIINDEGKRIDSVLLLPMLGTRSYTGEDTVEIHCHGGSLITRKVLETVLKAGARAARPGEFTFRAYMNGKMDLSQAEAVQELIGAKNEHALSAADNQLQGALSRKITEYQQELVSIAAIIEAWVDFPEEGLEFATLEEICNQLQTVVEKMQQLNATFHDGRIVHEGVSLCLVGSPNVGKSSLMNALLDKDRAIVSHIAGTTRDILEDHLRINGLNIRLMDTAGIRHQADEPIEQEGIRRSKKAMNEADVVLLVLDASRDISEEEFQLMAQVSPTKTILVWNKVDLPHNGFPSLHFDHVVAISAKEGNGLEALRCAIDKIVWSNGPPSHEEVVITKLRHHEALSQSIQACQNVIEGLSLDRSPEFLTIDMRQSLHALGKIIGTNITEDILTSIFSQFCIGK